MSRRAEGGRLAVPSLYVWIIGEDTAIKGILTVSYLKALSVWAVHISLTR